MVAQKKESASGSNVLTFPARPAMNEVAEQPTRQRELETEILALMQTLESEADPVEQKRIRAQLWQAVKTGRAE
ncbi:hypothetical protein [Duffyella gerundensis]|uniref:hypothetical protein n=1 Tax=Duffyella gerundensis TaxID=1619313 RepID=UPI003FD57BF2